MSAQVYVADHSLCPPALDVDGGRTWITRGSNFVILVSVVEAGARLRRPGNADESMIYLHDVSATIEAGDQVIQADPESLTIVPPGDSVVTALKAGTLVRIFSDQARDLMALAENAADYAERDPNVASLISAPPPPGGFRLRNYRLSEHGAPGSNMRVFRSTNLMVNPLARRDVPRDVATLSPHAHDDFEQASVVMEGRYIHHARYPWGPDLAAWREDEHLEAGCPSVTIIPARVIHTSRNIGGPGVLIDVFAPPRDDFERRGIVCNAADYPVARPEAVA